MLTPEIPLSELQYQNQVKRMKSTSKFSLENSPKKICFLSRKLQEQIFVLRTSNFCGATISR